MLGYLILLFTILPALELFVILKVGTVIGAFNTLLVVIVTGVVGAYLARMQGFLILNNIQNQMARGQLPTDQMLDGLMVLVGGIVLLTPGFITDIMGLLLLFPPTRLLIKIFLQQHFKRMVQRGEVVTFTSFQNQRRDDIIDI